MNAKEQAMSNDQVKRVGTRRLTPYINHYGLVSMAEDAEGDYVRYNDYAALLQQLAERDTEIARLNGIEQRALAFMGVDDTESEGDSSYWAARMMKSNRTWQERAESVAQELMQARDFNAELNILLEAAKHDRDAAERALKEAESNLAVAKLALREIAARKVLSTGVTVPDLSGVQANKVAFDALVATGDFLAADAADAQ